MNVRFCNKTITPIKSCHMHSHDCWELILQTDGHVKSVINGKTYDICEGDIIIIPPNVPHDGCSDVLYSDMFVQCENMYFTDVTVLHDYDGGVLSLMNLLHKTFTEKDKNYSLICDSLFNSISAYLDKYFNSEYKFRFVNELKNKLYLNISNSSFSIAAAVEETGFNADYVRRCFKEEMGVTPLEYFIGMRLGYAKELLVQQTFVSVADVSEKCGFNDSFYFSKLFKKHLGTSPLRYRQRCLADTAKTAKDREQ